MISDEEKIAQGAARFLCMDCGVDTDKSQEYYMLKLPVWRKINPQIDGMLCLLCAEKRLGRRLKSTDFSNAPVNQGQAKVCPELAARLYEVS